MHGTGRINFWCGEFWVDQFQRVLRLLNGPVSKTNSIVTIFKNSFSCKCTRFLSYVATPHEIELRLHILLPLFLLMLRIIVQHSTCARWFFQRSACLFYVLWLYGSQNFFTNIMYIFSLDVESLGFWFSFAMQICSLCFFEMFQMSSAKTNFSFFNELNICFNENNQQ